MMNAAVSESIEEAAKSIARAIAVAMGHMPNEEPDEKLIAEAGKATQTLKELLTCSTEDWTMQQSDNMPEDDNPYVIQSIHGRMHIAFPAVEQWVCPDNNKCYDQNQVVRFKRA